MEIRKVESRTSLWQRHGNGQDRELRRNHGPEQRVRRVAVRIVAGNGVRREVCDRDRVAIISNELEINAKPAEIPVITGENDLNAVALLGDGGGNEKALVNTLVDKRPIQGARIRSANGRNVALVDGGKAVVPGP